MRNSDWLPIMRKVIFLAAAASLVSGCITRSVGSTEFKMYSDARAEVIASVGGDNIKRKGGPDSGDCKFQTICFAGFPEGKIELFYNCNAEINDANFDGATIGLADNRKFVMPRGHKNIAVEYLMGIGIVAIYYSTGSDGFYGRFAAREAIDISSRSVTRYKVQKVPIKVCS